MIGVVGTWITRRIEKAPIGQYIAPPLIGISGILGGIVGFSDYLGKDDGAIWRTSLGCVIGASTGFVVGLYPYHTASVLIMTDIAYSLNKKRDR